jgi:hypothetical protein
MKENKSESLFLLTKEDLIIRLGNNKKGLNHINSSLFSTANLV